MTGQLDFLRQIAEVRIGGGHVDGPFRFPAPSPLYGRPSCEPATTGPSESLAFPVSRRTISDVSIVPHVIFSLSVADAGRTQQEEYRWITPLPFWRHAPASAASPPRSVLPISTPARNTSHCCWTL